MPGRQHCSGLPERAGQAGRREEGARAGSLTRAGGQSGTARSRGAGTLWGPQLSGLAELARLRGQAWPAVCPGLSASREGAGSCNGGGGPCAGGGTPPGRSRAGAAEAQPDVRSGLGEYGGSVRRPGVQGPGEVA